MKEVGGWMLPDADQHFVGSIETYQEQSFTFAMQHVPQQKRGLAIDVGAHVGIFSVRMARFFDRVLAFEPDVDNYECLVFNTLRCRASVRPIFGAVGNATKRCSTRVDALANSGARGVRFPPGSNVPMYRLDDIVDRMNAIPSLIKIDTEGFEAQVINGAAQILADARPVLIIERPDNPTHDFLLGLGYAKAYQLNKDAIYVENRQ